MKRKGTFKVALLLNAATKGDRDWLRGIMRFASTHHDWETYIMYGHPAESTQALISPQEADGVISSFFTYPKSGAWRQVKCAVVNGPVPGDASPGVRLECLDSDCRAIAETAADLFLSRGFASFAYIPTVAPRHWSEQRAKAFSDAVARRGFKTHIYPSHRSAREEDLAKWIAALPKPCGIFAAMDQRAQHVLYACRRAGIPVPEQVSVIGVDDDELICEYSRPTISSILLDFEAAGYHSAERLDRLMRGGKPSAKVWKYGVKGFVERGSTADVKGSAHIVSAARNFLRRNATSPIDVADIAKAVGVSVRTLQKRFAQVTDSSPSQELRNARLRKACDLLIHTQTPIDGIGELCGFASEIHLKALFKKTFGMTMRTYRERARTESVKDRQAAAKAPRRPSRPGLSPASSRP